MKKRLFSLVAAAGLLGLVASAQAGGLTPMSNSSLASVSAQGVNINQTSVVDLSDNSQQSAAGFVIANMAGTAANDQVNANVQCSIETSRFAPYQENNGVAINDVQMAFLPTTNSMTSGSKYAGFEYFNIKRKSNSCGSKCSFEEAMGEYGSSWHNTYQAYRSNKKSTSRVDLSGNAQQNAAGFVVANMSSSAANNQVNLNAQAEIKGGTWKAKAKTVTIPSNCCNPGSTTTTRTFTYSAPAFVPVQVNNGIAINNVGYY